jgi:hypothetical protein
MIEIIYLMVYLGVFGYIWVYLGKKSRREYPTELEYPRSNKI